MYKALVGSAVLAAALLAPKSASACTPYGLIRDKWLALSSQLGNCVDDEHDDGAGGRIQSFQFGFVDWDGSSSAAHAVYGVIGEKWASSGLAAGFGHPLNDETATRDGLGRFNDFTGGGSIYFKPNLGAWGVFGSIYALWNSNSRELGSFGYPASDEHPCTTAGGGSTCIGVPADTRVQYFYRNDGYSVTVYWRPDNSMAAYIVGGAILHTSGWFTTHTGW